jgi:Xaa-Pro aminopeptidase
MSVPLRLLANYLADKALDSFLVMRPENVRYLSGYTGEDSYLLVTRDRTLFVTDPRYTEQAAQECPGLAVVNWRDEAPSLPAALASLAKKAGLRSVAFESDYLTFSAHQTMAAAFGYSARLEPTTGVVEQYRKIKRPDEIAKLRESCAIADRALARLYDDIRPGLSEKELAAMLALHLVREGSDTKPYGGILISGKRTSLLHGIPSDKKIEKGDFVLVDFGGQYRGYLADMTRTVVVGRATDEQKEVYAYERAMVEATLAAIRAGVASKDVFAASTKPIEGTKYFGYHYTGIGHGIGLFVHELPFLSPRSDDVLAAGMVMTVEPGIYIPDWGGVRIEDQLLVTENGYENFTSTTKELVEI